MYIKNENAIMISVNPPYAQMIAKGYKTVEFRKQVLRSMLKIGSEDLFITINEEKVKYLPITVVYIYETKNKGGCGKVICRCLLDSVDQVGYLKQTDKDVLNYVPIRNDFIKYLYIYWCNFIKDKKPNLNEGWFKSKKFIKYLEEIGFETNFNYGIRLSNIDVFNEPIDLSHFCNVNGEILNKPPQNMCYANLSKINNRKNGDK